MQYLKNNDIYKVIRITGAQDNILGISFGENDVEIDNTDIEIVEWKFDNIKSDIVYTSKEEVLKQVLFGLKSINIALKTNYKLSKIYFCPFDKPHYKIYSSLVRKLILHYHYGRKFKEV